MQIVKNSTKNIQSGFTLLEILLVVAAIGILSGIVIFAINPAKQLADTRNAQRRVDVNTILNAIKQYQIGNNGTLPGASTNPGITSTTTEICQTGGSCTGLVDLSDLTNDGTYLVSMPADPTDSTADSTGYSVRTEDNNRVTVIGTYAENGLVVSVTN